MMTRTAHIIGLPMLVGGLIGIVLFMFLPKQYETRALIEAGVVWHPARNVLDGFDTIPVLIARVDTLQQTQVFEKEKGFVRPYRFRHVRTQPDPANAQLLYIFLKADNPAVAQNGLAELLESLLKEDKAIFLSRQGKLDHAMQAKSDQWGQSGAEVRALEQVIAELTEAGRFEEATLKWFERSRLAEQRNQFETELDHLKRVHTSARETRLVAAPTLPSEPTSPRLQLLLSVGIAFGMVIGMVINSIYRTRDDSLS